MMYELKNNDRIVGARTPEALKWRHRSMKKCSRKAWCTRTDDLTRRDVQAD